MRRGYWPRCTKLFLPLAQRMEDIEPNIDVELQRYLSFVTSPAAVWSGNFRQLSASITRLATLSDSGRIDTDQVDDEVARLQAAWGAPGRQSAVERHIASCATTFHLFDCLQLEAVIAVCLTAKNQADAGRTLFGQSRLAKASPNNSDRIRKFLARFELTWDQVQRLS